jgi:hypothetical protein
MMEQLELPFTRKTVHGVGTFYNYPILGIVKRTQTPAYATWSSMISRCYSERNESYPTYGGRGVSVCEDWLHYQEFAKWYHANHVEGWSMDKDALGGMIYSPETCIYVPEQVNQVLKSFDKLPKSVVGKSTNTWFVRTVDADNVQHYTGKFKSEEEAVAYYYQCLRQKMKDLVVKYSIPAATAHKLISL